MTRIWENMVYLIFDKSANPTPTLARLDISVQVEEKNFLKGFYKFFKCSGRKRYFGLFSALDMSPKGGSGCRSWELKWSTRCPSAALPPRWKTLRSAGNITTVSVETRTLGAKTFVLDDSRFCGGRITIWKKDESLKCQRCIACQSGGACIGRCARLIFSFSHLHAVSLVPGQGQGLGTSICN